MKELFAKVIRDGRGVAAVEFAIIVPVLLLMLGGLVDFALAFWNKGLLASSVAQGAEYAVLVGPDVLASNIQSVVGLKLAIPAAKITITGPGCYCVSGTPAAAVSTACVSLCPNATQATKPGTYVTISAQYTYTPFMPLYSKMTDTVLTETTVVRLK